MQKTIQNDTVVVRRGDLPFVNLDGEVGMLNISNGKYYSLESVGTRIWELLENSKSIEDIVSTLLQEYEVDKRVCYEQVIQFIENLKNENLIEVIC